MVHVVIKDLPSHVQVTMDLNGLSKTVVAMKTADGAKRCIFVILLCLIWRTLRVKNPVNVISIVCRTVRAKIAGLMAAVDHVDNVPQAMCANTGIAAIPIARAKNVVSMDAVVNAVGVIIGRLVHQKTFANAIGDVKLIIQPDALTAHAGNLYVRKTRHAVTGNGISFVHPSALSLANADHAILTAQERNAVMTDAEASVASVHRIVNV